MDRFCLVCRFVALLLSIVSLTQSSSITGIITPTTPSAFNRRNIVLNCTLQGNITSERSAQNVSFAFTNDDVKSKAHIQVINDSTVKLTIVGVYVNMSSSRISCLLGNDILDEVSIVVDDPRFPNHIECIVYNWESMTCTWDVEDTANVSISMAYSRGRVGDKLYACPRQGVKRCSWDSQMANRNQYFETSYTVVLFRNASGRELELLQETEKTFESKRIVKPNKVSSFELVNVTSDHIELRWAVHPSRKPINYRVTYESPFSPTAVRNTSETSIVLSNLIPNTNYMITIDCIPLLRNKASLAAIGFWSDEETMHVATKSDGRLIITRWKNVGGTMTQFCLSETEQAQPHV